MGKEKKNRIFFRACFIRSGSHRTGSVDKATGSRASEESGGYSLIPNVLSLHYLENRGAAFGIFQNQKVFLVLLTSAILLGVCYILWKLPEGKRFLPMKILCFLITAGGIGNLIDRLRLNYVVDFIYFSLIDFPVFNVADIYVTVSMVLLFVLVLFYYKDEEFQFLKWKSSKEQE